jgi:hypothetical protein
VLRETVGDGGREAYTAIVRGGKLSHEMRKFAEAETVTEVEGNTCGAVMQGADALPRSKTPSRTKGLRRNLGGLTFDRCWVTGPVRIGKARSRSR